MTMSESEGNPGEETLGIKEKVGTESQKRDNMAINVALNSDLSNVTMSERERISGEDTVGIKEEVKDMFDGDFYDNVELVVEIKNENNYDTDLEMKSEATAPNISSESAVQLTDSGDGESEMQSFMGERETLQKHVRIASEPLSESNTASGKEVREEDTKYGLADIIASNPVALENGDVMMLKERENFKRTREEADDSDLEDVKDEVKMEIVDEEIEEKSHKKQKLVSL